MGLLRHGESQLSSRMDSDTVQTSSCQILEAIDGEFGYAGNT